MKNVHFFYLLDKKYILIGVAIFCAIIPLYISSLANSLGKLFALTLLILLVILNRSSQEKSPLNSLEKWAIYGSMTYVLIFFVSYLASMPIDPDQIWRIESPLFILLLCLFYWVCIRLNQREKILQLVSFASLTGAILLLAIEVSELDSFIGYRYSAPSEGTRGLAATGFITPITAILFLSLWGQKNKGIYLFGFFIMIMLSGLNQSRTSTLILFFPLVISFIYIAFFYKSIKEKTKLLVLTAIIVLIAISGIFVKDRIKQSIISINSIQQGQLDTSLGLRYAMLNIGITMIKQKPLAGTGINNYSKTLTDTVNSTDYSEYVKNSLLSFTHLHNQYVMSWIFSGILGLLSVLFLLFFPLYCSTKSFFSNKNEDFKKKLIFSLISGVFLGIGFVMFFGAILTYTYTTIFYMLSMLSLISYISLENDHA